MEKVKYRISKSNVECYKIRCDSFYWADINIDASGNTGRIQIASDFGDWQYYWGSCGCPFKEFLAGLNIDYVAGKFGANKWFDLDGTIKSLKETIKYFRPDKELKSELMGEIKNLENSSGENEFVHIMHDCDRIMEMTNHCPDMVYGISPGFKRFWKEIWPVFIKEIQKEPVNQQL